MNSAFSELIIKTTKVNFFVFVLQKSILKSNIDFEVLFFNELMQILRENYENKTRILFERKNQKLTFKISKIKFFAFWNKLFKQKSSFKMLAKTSQIIFRKASKILLDRIKINANVQNKIRLEKKNLAWETLKLFQLPEIIKDFKPEKPYNKIHFKYHVFDSQKQLFKEEKIFRNYF